MPVAQPREPRPTPEQVIDARAEARRRIERRETHAELLREAAHLEGLIAKVDELVAAGVVVEATERARLVEEHTAARLAILSTSTMAWNTALERVRAREGEGIAETTWRVLLDRGATGYQIAALLADESSEPKDSALRKRMDRWRDELRGELLEFRHEMRLQRCPWARTIEILDGVEDMLKRLG